MSRDTMRRHQVEKGDALALDQAQDLQQFRVSTIWRSPAAERPGSAHAGQMEQGNGSGIPRRSAVWW